MKSSLVCLIIAACARLAFETVSSRMMLLAAIILAVYGAGALFLALFYFSITVSDRIGRIRRRRLLKKREAAILSRWFP
jgi:hypothetical protein